MKKIVIGDPLIEAPINHESNFKRVKITYVQFEP